MPDRLQTYPLEFQGGLISNVSQLQHGMQAPGSATVLTNFEPSVDGGYRRIEGFSKFADNAVTGSGAIRGVFYFSGAAYAVRNQNVYFSGGGSAAWTSITTSTTLDTSGTGVVRFEKLNYSGADTLIIVDGLSYPFRYKSSTFEELTSLPSSIEGANHVINFQNHLFVAKGSEVFFSAPFDEADFTPASGAGSFKLDDASNVTGLKVFRYQLIIFTERSIHRLAGQSVANFQLTPITRDLGCTESDTIQEVGGDVMFLAPDGLRLLSATERNNDFGLAVVSRNIQNDILEFIANNPSFSSAVVRSKSQYRLLGFNSDFTSDSAQGIIAVQRAAQGGVGVEFARTLGINARVAYSDLVENTERILFANSDGYVYNMESGNSFDGGNISATFKTPFFPINDPSVRKQLHKMELFTDPQGTIDLDVGVKYDFDREEVLQPPTITVANTAGTVASIFGSARYAAENATANVNGAVTNSTNVAVDGNSGTIAVGMTVSGGGITGLVTVSTVSDQNNIVLSTAVTLADDAPLVFTTNSSEVFTFGGQLKSYFKLDTIGSGDVISLQFTSDSTVPTFSLESASLQYLMSGRR